MCSNFNLSKDEIYLQLYMTPCEVLGRYKCALSSCHWPRCLLHRPPSLKSTGNGEHDHIASDLFNIHESDREMKPDVYVSKAAHVEGFPKSFEKIGGTISGQNRLSLTNIYYYVEKLNCIIVLI